MITLSKMLTRKPLNLVSDCLRLTNQRSIFTADYFGLNSFKAYSEKMEQENGKNLDFIRSTMEQNLAKTDGKVFTEDLKTLLYLTKTDSDIELLLNAVKKYTSQNASAIFNFNFEPPLSKLLINLNKIDKALEIFGEKNEYKFKILRTPRLVTMNKLLELQRYSDVLNLAKIEIADFKVRKANKKEGEKVFVGHQLLNIVCHAAMELNTPDALKDAKEMCDIAVENGEFLQSKTAALLFLLAVEQNDLEFAYELATKIKESSFLNKNLKIIALAKLNRIDKALDIVKLNLNSARPRFNSTTVQVLTDAIEKSGDNAKKSDFDDLKVKMEISTETLKTIITKPIEKRLKDERQGNQNLREGNQSFREGNQNFREGNQSFRGPQRNFNRDESQRNFNRDEPRRQNFNRDRRVNPFSENDEDSDRGNQINFRRQNREFDEEVEENEGNDNRRNFNNRGQNNTFRRSGETPRRNFRNEE